MHHHDEDKHEEEKPSQGGGSGDRPATPSEGTRPPGNEEVDPNRVESGKDQLRETGAN